MSAMVVFAVLFALFTPSSGVAFDIPPIYSDYNSINFQDLLETVPFPSENLERLAVQFNGLVNRAPISAENFPGLGLGGGDTPVPLGGAATDVLESIGNDFSVSNLQNQDSNLPREFSELLTRFEQRFGNRKGSFESAAAVEVPQAPMLFDILNEY